VPLHLEASDPSLNTGVNLVVSAGGGIEVLFGGHGVLLDLEAEGEDGGEGVCELQDTDCAHKAGDVAELRDGGADNPGESPVGRDERYPEPFAGFAGKRWCV